MRTCVILICGCLLWARTAECRDIDFNQDVRPILSNNCLLCHGPDESSVEAGLRLDQRESAVRPLESGETAIVPGKPDASELIRRVLSDDESERMPPPEHGPRLTDQQIGILKDWIAQGAHYSAHWSYVPPQRPQIPQVPEQYQSWPRNPIDCFTLTQMQKHGLSPSDEAQRYALVRRVFLDVIGLPPTVEEADAFVQNNDPQAYEDLVDDLLRRPAFGEHWARKWLDLARYADSAGYADDPPRTIWAYRDWVIRAFNSNMPFDQFTIEQLAGDLLPNASEDQLIATAFHRNTLTNNEGGTQDEEFRNVAVVDRVNTTMAVWMGTTMACAQCHNHKYDPLTQEEYFRLFAILNNTQDADRRDESPVIQIFTAEQKQQKRNWQQQIEELERELDRSTPELLASQQQWEEKIQTAGQWYTGTVAGVRRSSGEQIHADESGTISVPTAADKDTYTVDVEIGSSGSPGVLTAARIETLPSEQLPGKGSGHGGGNFVITGVRAQFIPTEDRPPKARYVRITNNGKKQILSLAEVEVFSDGRNIASEGRAVQHSTAFAGGPQLAIDGNTNGDYEQKSVTHTETVDNPWWELDLESERPVERVKIWNRTDNNLHTRLTDFTIELLDSQRKPVWSSSVKEAPNPSAEFEASRTREIRFARALADYHQPDFEPSDVLTHATGQKDGWAVGGATGRPHALILVTDRPFTFSEPGTLRLLIEQQSVHKQHLLGRFRISLTDDKSVVERSAIPGDIAAILQQKSDRTAEQQNKLADWYRHNVAPELAAQRARLKKLQQQLANMKPATSVPILRELTKNRRRTHLQYRGNYLDKGPEVTPGVPAVFPPLPAGAAPDRLALAKWLVSDQNPLTARVLVNRYWETLFGKGLVVTSEEFGSQGEPPTHPALLDWLATEVVRSGWDRKHLIRLIVTSATYRQTARVSAEKLAADPDNRWLARGPRVRLTAEMVRDQALFVSGLLSPVMYGPPVKPPQPALGLTAAFGSSTDWKTSSGENKYRRGLYTTWRRSNPYPSMATFDAPNREVCTIRRNRTNTPLQSLVTLNDPVYVEAAQALARAALRHGDSLPQQVAFAFRRCVTRPPSDAELTLLQQLFHDTQAELSGNSDRATWLATEPLGPLPDHMAPEDAAAMTVVCNVLLNLDEMFLKR